MIKILAISGSLRTCSSNAAILQAALGLMPKDVHISLYEGLGNLPHFNPDLDSGDALPTVQDWRDRLKESDAVLFCTPEYAHGVPGVLKNALDWIVSSGEFMHKPTAVISASPSADGGDKANASLVQTLKVMMAEIPTGATLCIPGVSVKLSAQGELADLATQEGLRSLINTLIAFITEKEPPQSHDSHLP